MPWVIDIQLARFLSKMPCVIDVQAEGVDSVALERVSDPQCTLTAGRTHFRSGLL